MFSLLYSHYTACWGNLAMQKTTRSCNKRVVSPAQKVQGIIMRMPILGSTRAAVETIIFLF